MNLRKIRPFAFYLLAWTLNQYYALLYKDKYPDRVSVVRAEDVMQDSRKTLGAVCERLGLEVTDSLCKTTWNGCELNEVYPWGMIRVPTPEANRATASQLSTAQIEEIRMRARPYLEALDYKSFI